MISFLNGIERGRVVQGTVLDLVPSFPDRPE